MDEKAAHEYEVFAEFCRAASLPVPAGSIQAREPPEPDILCTLAGEATYFELARLLDPEAPGLKLEALRRAPEPVVVVPERFGLPERDVLIQKLQKVYETHGLPLELLLYFDAGSFLTDGAIPPFVEFPYHAAYVMQPLLERSSGPFRRTWVYERYRQSVLWVYPSAPGNAD